MVEKKTRALSWKCILVGSLLACGILFGLGVVVGIFSRSTSPSQGSPPIIVQDSSYWSQKPALQSYEGRCHEAVRQAESCSVPLPRHYVAYSLAGNQTITVDGRLDDQAWAEVPWTENFVDIRGLEYPVPLSTRAKIRWDDENVYVGAYLEEYKPWATYDQKDTRIYQENAFEVFLDVDRSMSMYKEIEINVINTTWDLMLSRAYMDGGDWSDWEGIADKGVHTDGVPNNASVRATYWSLELAFPYPDLNQNTTRTHLTAVDGEVWFMILARPQYEVIALPNGTYTKKNGTDASWYSWNPIGAVNLHLPSRWGLLFFKTGTPSMQPVVKYDTWIVYQTLFDIFEAEKAFRALNNMYIDNLSKLRLPPYVTSGCVLSATVELIGEGFEAAVVSHQEPHRKGHIREDRRVWFTDI